MMAMDDLEQVILMLDLALEWMESRSAAFDSDLDELRIRLAHAQTEALRLRGLGLTPS